MTMEKKSAEHRAAQRWGYQLEVLSDIALRTGYATCIREEVEPLEERILDLEASIELKDQENAKFRALVQELANDMRRLRIEFGNRTGTTTQIGVVSLVRANEHGFVPTNTTEG